jgi:hypothetical protein
MAALITMLLFVCSVESLSQVKIGPSVGYSFGVPLTVDREPGIVNRYGAIRHGQSYDHAGWFGVSLLAPRFSDPFDLSAELGLALSAGRFTSDPFPFGNIFDPAIQAIVIPTRQFEVSTALSALQLDGQLHFRLTDDWSFGFGPWMQYRITSNILQNENLVDHPEARYDDSSRSHVIAGGEAIGAARLRYGPLLSAALRLPLSDGIELWPRIDLRLDAGAMAEGIELRRALRAGGGIALLLDAGRHTPRADTPPPVATVQQPKRERLEASVRLFSGGEGNDSSATIRLTSTLYRQSVLLLPALFFEANSSGIPERYVRLGNREARSFSERSLVRLDPVASYRQILNLLGTRMLAEPSARLQLEGSASSDEPATLARERAESVRRYLHEVWKIDESRIETGTARSTRQAMNSGRCVIFRSTSQRVMEPVMSEWRVKGSQAPPFGVTRQIIADAGLRRWSLALYHEGKELARYDSRGEGDLSRIPLSLPIGSGSSGTTLEPLVAELEVEDSLGGKVVARDELPLRREGSSEKEGTGDEKEVMTLLLTDGDLRHSISGDAIESMEQLAASIRDGAEITLWRSQSPDDRERTAESADLDDAGATFLAALKRHGIHPSRFLIQERRTESDREPTPEETIFSSSVHLLVEQEEISDRSGRP